MHNQLLCIHVFCSAVMFRWLKYAALVDNIKFYEQFENLDHLYLEDLLGEILIEGLSFLLSVYSLIETVKLTSVTEILIHDFYQKYEFHIILMHL